MGGISKSETPSERLLKALKTLKISQRAVAMKLGMHQQTLNRYVHGVTPRAEFLGMLALHYNVSPLWITTGNGPMFITETSEPNRPAQGPHVTPDRRTTEISAIPKLVVGEPNALYRQDGNGSGLGELHGTVARIDQAWREGKLSSSSKCIIGGVVCILNALPIDKDRTP